MTLRPISAGRPLSLDIAGALAVPSDLAAAIDAIWATETALRPHLFDGPILSVTDIAPNRLTLLRASYRHSLAARRDPGIAARLKLRPLAVSGVLTCPDGLVFGRRGADVTQASGAWELVPSGGAVSADLEAQILEELEEEIGLARSQVAVMPPYGLVESDGVIDVVMPLSTRARRDEILALHRGLASREYAELLICPAEEPKLAALPLLAETRVILASLSGSTPAS